MTTRRTKPEHTNRPFNFDWYDSPERFGINMSKVCNVTGISELLDINPDKLRSLLRRDANAPVPYVSNYLTTPVYYREEMEDWLYKLGMIVELESVRKDYAALAIVETLDNSEKYVYPLQIMEMARKTKEMTE